MVNRDGVVTVEAVLWGMRWGIGRFWREGSVQKCPGGSEGLRELREVLSRYLTTH